MRYMSLKSTCGLDPKGQLAEQTRAVVEKIKKSARPTENA